MHAHPLFKELLLIAFLTLSVILFNAYILPMIFPFLAAYVLMRFLQPGIQYLNKHLHFPLWLAYLCLLTLLFLLIFFALLWFAHSLLHQCRLLATNISVYYQLYNDTLWQCCKNICHKMDGYLALDAGHCMEFVQKQFSKMQPDSSIKFYHKTCQLFFQGLGNIFHGTLFLLIVGISMILLCKDYTPLQQLLRHNRFYHVFSQVGHTLLDIGILYFRNQCIILILIWGICSLALFLIGNPYSLLLGLLISFFDALPVLGSGMILLPWAGFYLLPFYQLPGKYYHAAVLFTAYLLCVFLREFLETKWMSGQMQILPIFTFASIYIGTKLYGVVGIFLGPLSLTLLLSLYRIWKTN